ncbi:Early meiotic induction protein 1 [Ceratocystis lukuohia]|uniref:Early meiotic induction protein 1 n=1 Tax=Ceratocystis lukuohia TaxID=2019550 RepID=A0ABR4MFH1_9PEZI
MGWFWSSNSQGPLKDTHTTGPRPTTPDSTAKPETATVPDTNTDPELQKFVDLFTSSTSPSSGLNAGTSTSTSPSTSTNTSTRPQSATPSSSSSRPYWLPAFVTAPPTPTPSDASSACPDTLSPIAEAILPVEMSCSQAFDMAFACQSLGGQWNSIYRTGEMRSCSDLWSDFWFCMRHNGSSGPVTENLIRGHYRHKEWEKYYAPGKHSSEDVWRSREDRVPLDTAFKTPVPRFEENE